MALNEKWFHIFFFSAGMCLIQSTLLGDYLRNCIFWNEGCGWRAAAWGKILEKLRGPLGPLLAQRQAFQVSFRHKSLILLEKTQVLPFFVSNCVWLTKSTQFCFHFPFWWTVAKLDWADGTPMIVCHLPSAVHMNMPSSQEPDQIAM